MGVVNVTPDSFSDGGLYLDPAAAIAHGRELAAAGAAILDVGGESTRPGAEPVAADEELRRVEPVVAGLAGVGPTRSRSTPRRRRSPRRRSTRGPRSSTTSPPCAAIPRWPRWSPTAARPRPHAHGRRPADDAGQPALRRRGRRGRDFLAARLEAAVAAGVAEERIWLDPGHRLRQDRPPQLRTARGSPELASSAGRSSSAPRARASSAAPTAPRPTTASAARSPPRSSPPPGRRVLRVHDVAEVAPGAGRGDGGPWVGSPGDGGTDHTATASSRAPKSSCAASRSTPTTG